MAGMSHNAEDDQNSNGSRHDRFLIEMQTCDLKYAKFKFRNARNRQSQNKRKDSLLLR
jgi:hypothetical protein